MNQNNLLWYRSYLTNNVNEPSVVYFPITFFKDIKDIGSEISSIFYNHKIDMVDKINMKDNMCCFCVDGIGQVSVFISFSKKSIEFLKELNELYGDLV